MAWSTPSPRQQQPFAGLGTIANGFCHPCPGCGLHASLLVSSWGALFLSPNVTFRIQLYAFLVDMR